MRKKWKEKSKKEASQDLVQPDLMYTNGFHRTRRKSLRKKTLQASVPLVPMSYI